MASVEEICDDIVLINKSKIVLDGKLVQLKQQFKNHQFEISIETETDLSILFDNSPHFSLIEISHINNQYHLSVQLHNEVTGNQLLQQLLPLGNLITFKEILPTMNDIFIKKVNETK